MSFLDEIEKMVFGTGPFVLKTIKGKQQSWDLVVIPSGMSVKPGPSAPTPITILKIGVMALKNFDLTLEVRGGSWNDKLNKPVGGLPRIKGLLLSSFLVAGNPESTIRDIFGDDKVLENIYALRNVYLSVEENDAGTTDFYFDGEVVFGSAIDVSRVKKMVACFEIWLPKIEEWASSAVAINTAGNVKT